MHWIQATLLDLAKAHDIAGMRRAELVRLVGCRYQSQIDHHLRRLLSAGALVEKDGRFVPAITSGAGLLRIPIMGEADCGEATKFADGRVVDYLTVSPSVINTKNTNSIYALVAKGNSMDNADVSGKTISDGDYVIVQRKNAYEPGDGEIIVSDVGGLVNVKRFRRDSANNRIVLVSDSHRQQDFTPIIISEFDDYSILGKVVDVIKGVNV